MFIKMKWFLLLFAIGSILAQLQCAHAVSDTPYDVVAFASIPSASTYGAGTQIVVSGALPGSQPCAAGLSTVTALSDGSNWQCGPALVPLEGGSATVVSNSVGNAFPVVGNGNAQTAANTGASMVTVGRAGVIRTMRCDSLTAAGSAVVCGGTSYRLTLQKNGANTIVTCDCTAAINTCSDSTNGATVALGDHINWFASPSTSPTAVIFKCSVIEYDQ